MHFGKTSCYKAFQLETLAMSQQGQYFGQDKEVFCHFKSIFLLHKNHYRNIFHSGLVFGIW